MNTIKLSLSIFCLYSLINLSMALTLTTDEHYYLVVPKSENDIERAIYESSPIMGGNHQAFKAVGLHQARYTYNQTLKYNTKKCFIGKINVILDSKIYLPKIDMDARRYTDRILMKFKVEAHDIVVHEQKHRKIYRDQLQILASKLRKINEKDTTFTNCKDLDNHIKAEFSKTEKIINQQNLNFDCFEYGKKMQLDICKKATIAGQKEKASPLSSLTQGEASDVKSYQDKPNKETCDGQLIEPFKGKFYCVPADSYSEL